MMTVPKILPGPNIFSRKNTDDSPAKTGPRPRIAASSRRRFSLVMSAAVGMAAVFGGGWVLMKSDYVVRAVDSIKWQMISASVKMGLTVEDVLVIGRRETLRENLLDAVQVTRGAPILALDFETAKARLEALPWIRIASVERMLPGTVVLRLVEREPMALWQHDGQFALIDREGEVIVREGLDRFSDLLVVVGKGAPENIGGLLEVLETQPGLMARVKTAVRVGNRRWDVRMDNGLGVRLPEENPQRAWARLADMERSHNILSRNVEVLDLRLPDRMVIKQPQMPVPKPGKRTGKDT